MAISQDFVTFAIPRALAERLGAIARLRGLPAGAPIVVELLELALQVCEERVEPVTPAPASVDVDE